MQHEDAEIGKKKRAAAARRRKPATAGLVSADGYTKDILCFAEDAPLVRKAPDLRIALETCVEQLKCPSMNADEWAALIDDIDALLADSYPQ